MAHSALETAPMRMDTSLSEAGPFALIIRVVGGESPGLPPVPGQGLPLGEKRIIPSCWLYLLRMLNSSTRC